MKDIPALAGHGSILWSHQRSSSRALDAPFWPMSTCAHLCRHRHTNVKSYLLIGFSLNILDLFIYLFIYLISCIWVHCSYFQTHQKRASDLITDGCEPPCCCWEVNSWPLEEQSVLLTTEPSLQPYLFLSWARVTLCRSDSLEFTI